MSLSAREHRQVQAATRQQRNAAARARRAAPVHFVRVLRCSGEIIFAAQSRSALGAAYELKEVAPDHWICSCQGFAFRGRCAHVAAAAAIGKEDDHAPAAS